MQLELESKGIKDEDKIFMPYVKHNPMPLYCILRLGKKITSIPLVKGFEKHMKREIDTPNADPEKLKDNEQLYGPENIYKDIKDYLQDCKLQKNNVVCREMLITATPQFFKGISKQDFQLWKDANLEWLQMTFRNNLRAVYLHMDESTPHCHVLLSCKQWSNKYKGYTIRNNAYFNGKQMLTEMQDNYAEFMQRKFPVLQRGIKGSRATHISMKKLYAMNNAIEKETDIETLKAKAMNQEYLKKKVNYMDKTLKSTEYFNKKDREENKKLKEENNNLREELKDIKNMILAMQQDKDKIFHQSQDQKQNISRGFTGNRYSK